MEKTYNNQYLQNLINQAIGYGDNTPKLEAYNQGASQNTVVPIDQDLKNRTAGRIFVEEIRRQQNLEDVFDSADEELSKNSHNEEKPIDDNWTQRFITFAKDITDSELKTYWGRLLAGEIKSPGSYSYRTMQLMSQLTKREAERIREVFKYVLFSFDRINAQIIKTQSYSPITMEQLLFMQELGLIDSKDTLSINYTNKDLGNEQYYVFSRNGIGVVFMSKAAKVQIPVYRLTSIGKEFLFLNSDVEVDVDYLKKVAELTAKEKNKDVSAKCGKIVLVGEDYWMMSESFFETEGDNSTKP